MRYLSLVLVAAGGLGMLVLSGCSSCAPAADESASSSER